MATVTNKSKRSVDLKAAKADLFRILRAAPGEIPAVLCALHEGRTHGMLLYVDRGCGCILAQVADARGLGSAHRLEESALVSGWISDSEMRPIEDFILDLRPGDTPANNATARQVEEWIAEFLASEASAS